MTTGMKEQWEVMLRKSFSPRQFFLEYLEEDDPNHCQEDKIMWVYRKLSNGLWSVGFYSPEREWHQDGEFHDKNTAAARVNYLNGGK